MNCKSGRRGTPLPRDATVRAFAHHALVSQFGQGWPLHDVRDYDVDATRSAARTDSLPLSTWLMG